jgi:hypothetical protein
MFIYYDYLNFVFWKQVFNLTSFPDDCKLEFRSRRIGTLFIYLISKKMVATRIIKLNSFNQIISILFIFFGLKNL